MAHTFRKVVAELSEDRKRIVRGTVKSTVLFDPPSTELTRRGPAAALNAAGVPQIGDPWNYNGDVLTRVVCVDRKCRQRENHPDLFDLDLQYSDERYDDGTSEVNPLLRPAKYSWAFDQFQKAMERDLDTSNPSFPNGYPIVNSVGDPFSSAPLVDDSRPVGRVMRNEATFPVNWAEYYMDATNSSDVTINGQSFAARTLKMRCITSGETQYESGVTYYTVTYDIQIRREGWKLKLLNSGFRSYLQPDGTLGGADIDPTCATVQPVPIRDQNGVIVPNESRLSDDGVSSKPLCPDEDSVYLEFVVYREVDFNTLGL